MSDAKPIVLIVDDDPALRASLERLLRSVGLDTQLFASIPDFLKSDLPDGPACLVLDVRLPGRTGLDLQRELAASNIQIPIIFITGHGDIPMSVQAMKRGAIEFLTKPFRDQELVEAIHLGLARDRAHRENEPSLAALRERFEVANPARTRDHDPGRARPPQQTDCVRYRDQRNDREGPPEPSDEEDESRLSPRARPNGG